MGEDRRGPGASGQQRPDSSVTDGLLSQSGGCSGATPLDTVMGPQAQLGLEGAGPSLAALKGHGPSLVESR